MQDKSEDWAAVLRCSVLQALLQAGRITQEEYERLRHRK